MLLTAAQMSAIVASRATVSASLRRTAPIWATVERGLRHPHLCGISLHALLTPPLRWNRHQCAEGRVAQTKAGRGDGAQSFSTTFAVGGQFLRIGDDSVVALETGATGDSS